MLNSGVTPSPPCSFCFLPIPPCLPCLPALWLAHVGLDWSRVSLNSFLSFFSFVSSSIFLSCQAPPPSLTDYWLSVLGWESGLARTNCVGRCLSPSEPVSQHCPGDWSLSLVPRPPGRSQWLWVQPVLLSQKRFPSWAGQVCGLKLSRSELESRGLLSFASPGHLLSPGCRGQTRRRAWAYPPPGPLACIGRGAGPGSSSTSHPSHGSSAPQAEVQPTSE